MPTQEQIDQWRVAVFPGGRELSTWELAMLWLLLDEINTLRAEITTLRAIHSLGPRDPRTKQQVITALRNRAADLTVD